MMSMLWFCLALLTVTVSGRRKSTADKAPQGGLADIVSGSMLEKLRAMKRPEFKEVWPKTCAGMNINGEQKYEKAALDGFLCLKEDGDNVGQPISIGWANVGKNGYTCCDGACSLPKSIKCKGFSLQSAALALAKAVTKIEIGDPNEDSDDVEVMHDEPGEEEQAQGIKEISVLRIPQSVIPFEEKKSRLTQAGVAKIKTVAKEITPTLALFASVHEGAQMIMCVHGMTTACKREWDAPKGKRCNPIGKKLFYLPKGRSMAIGNMMQQEVGDAVSLQFNPKTNTFAHFAYEKIRGNTQIDNKNFKGGREGFIIIKTWTGEGEPPKCDFAEFYQYYKPEAPEAKAVNDNLHEEEQDEDIVDEDEHVEEDIVEEDDEDDEAVVKNIEDAD